MLLIDRSRGAIVVQGARGVRCLGLDYMYLLLFDCEISAKLAIIALSQASAYRAYCTVYANYQCMSFSRDMQT